MSGDGVWGSGAGFSRTRVRPGVTLLANTTVVAQSYPVVESRGSRLRPAPMQPQAGMLIGSRYRLCTPLGEGGIGEVWDAEDLVAGDRVAVKLLRSEFSCDPTTLERFLREGRLASALHHPHIVRVHEVGGADHAMPFLVMERLPGPCLEDVVIEQGVLCWARAQRVLLQICAALEHAHRARIVHHDVKPSNIVLANAPGEREEGKLVDFGIARKNLTQEPDVQLTMEGQVLGSPGYISPEQLRGKRTNHRSDIYGLGCTAFHLLTGRPPVEAENLPALIHAALFTPPPPLGSIEAPQESRPAIEALIHRALSKDPKDRFASALHMAHAIAAIDA